MIPPGRADEGGPRTEVDGALPLGLEHVVPHVSANQIQQNQDDEEKSGSAT